MVWGCLPLYIAGVDKQEQPKYIPWHALISHIPPEPLHWANTSKLLLFECDWNASDADLINGQSVSVEIPFQ